MSEQLAKRWGQAVVVDNKPGGNGFIAIAALKQASTDGHDLILLDSNHTTTHPSTFSKLPYNVSQDFAPISMILRTPFFFAVAMDSPYQSIEDIVAAARQKPAGVNYGSWFVGSPGHIGALQLEKFRDVKMTHVPYKDFGQLYAAVSNKEVDFALASVASGGQMERGGRMRFLNVAAPQRDPLYPNVVATSEVPALKGFEVSAWAGIFAPKNAPPAVIERVSSDIAAIMKMPEIQERNRTFGYEVPPLSPVQFGELIAQETTAWRGVIKASNLQLD